MAGAEGELVGRVVTSRQGRDQGHRYVVVAAMPNDLVLVADGERRTIDRPKKKNLRHLVLHDVVPELAERLGGGVMPRDEELRAALEPYRAAASRGGEAAPVSEPRGEG